jgi:hypothetical protein
MTTRNANMNQQQHQFLMNRVQLHVNELKPASIYRGTDYDKYTKPAKVAAAEKKLVELQDLIRAWQKSIDLEEKERADAIKKAELKVRDVILFGTIEEARKAVEAFELLN